MLTVPQAAKRVGRNPETVRRWIREGKLLSRRVCTQHVIEETDLDRLARGREAEMLPLPKDWATEHARRGLPNPVEAVRRAREGR